MSKKLKIREVETRMMAEQHQIRRRPRDQSSDEDENEENETDIIPPQQPSPHSVPPSDDVKEQSVSNDVAADGDVQSEPEPPSVSLAASDRKECAENVPSFSMFRGATTRCGGNGKSSGIVSCCDALQRLGAALRAYSAMKSKERGRNEDDDDEIEPEEPALSEFVGSDYRLQFLEDFNHFMAEHQESTEEIKGEMVECFGLRRCEAMRCHFTSRHFGRAQSADKRASVDGRAMFYRQKLDALHFQIWHLEQSGYRYRSTRRVQAENDGTSKKEDDDDDEKAIDRELEEAVSAINDSKKKCAFGRFQGDGPNKFTLSVSGIDSACFAVIFAVTLCAHPFSQNVDGSNGG
ncbi:MAG: hypothetical protein GY822_06125, partial [Deltaproteobacteria bacterium]|nr:hypothetical protein [Deltaproteobacteria bacterium]